MSNRGQQQILFSYHTDGGPFFAYDSNSVEDVGDDGMSLYNPTNNKAYVLDPLTDVVWVHDLTNFSTDPVQVSMNLEPLSGYGCIDREGRLLWMGENSTGTSRHLIAYDTTNGTIYDFGDLSTDVFGGWSWSILAAEYNSGSPRIWIDIIGSGGLKRYSPNLGTETLGTEDHSYSDFNHEYTQPATWDSDGSRWFAAQSTWLYQVSASTSDLAQHVYPSAYVSPTNTAGIGNQIMVWDSDQGKLYVPLGNGPSSQSALLRFTPPATFTDDGGEWGLVSYFSSTAPPIFRWTVDPVYCWFLRETMSTGIYWKRGSLWIQSMWLGWVWVLQQQRPIYVRT